MLDERHGEMSAAGADHARRLGEPHGRGAKDRTTVPLTERGELLDLADGVERQAGDRRLAVDRHLGQPQLLRHPGRHLGEEGFPEGLDGVILDPQARRCRMAAAGEEMGAAGLERGENVEAGHAPEAPRRRPPLMLVLGDDDDRAVVALGKPAGHDPHHARMPATAGEDQRRRGDRIEIVGGLPRGGQEDAPLEGVALFVEAMDHIGQLEGAGLVGGGEHLDRQAGLAEPPGGIEPRRQPEGDILALERRLLLELGQLHQPHDPGAAPQSEALEAMLDEDPVLVEEGHDVGDGAERRQADGPQEHLPQPRRHVLGATGPCGDRPGELEGHRGATQVAEGIAAPREPGMNEHRRLGERGAEAVVVGDDQIDPQLAGHVRLGGACDPAVDGDHELCPLRRQAAERLGVEAVALLEAVGHIPFRRRPEGLETAEEDCRGAHAVGVVIAVDHDPRAVACGGEDPLGGGRHAGEQFGITEILERAGEERPGGGGVDEPARRE